jgi:hypothetical protein
MLAPNIFALTRIQGLAIAAGRATWVTDDNGKKGHYSFEDDDAFGWKLTPAQIKDLDIDEQDLLSCVEQADKQFGDPEVFRPKLGLMPDSGYMNIGATFISKTNKNIMCVFTPTSMAYTVTNSLEQDRATIDGYFEWYYSPVSLAQDADKDPEKFMQQFDKITGNRSSNMAKSPVIDMPSYEEASVFSSEVIQEDCERERFLQQVWDYHHSKSQLAKQRLKEDALPTWKRIWRVTKALSVYED